MVSVLIMVIMHTWFKYCHEFRMLVVESIGKFGKSIQNFTFQSFTMHRILSINNGQSLLFISIDFEVLKANLVIA